MSWISQIFGGSDGPAQPETWTPALVGKELVAAVRWAHRSGGRVGPAGMKSCLPSFIASLDDHLEEGWGLPEILEAEDDRHRKMMVPLSPKMITRHEAALEWPSRYLAGENIGSARMVALWARAKVTRRTFDALLKARGTISRSNAYRLRDRGLSLISQGLDRDGVPLP
jgi:hypothetical protein